MKKSLLALAILSSFAGAASAATSVTLYGTVEAAYYRNPTGTDSGTQQYSSDDSRLGIKGTEDLGNGIQAFFQLESGLDASTGSNHIPGQFFDQKSLVGLSFDNGAHKVYFGRSATPLDQIVGYSSDRLASGLNTKASLGTWSNGAFYDFNTNGLTVAAAATTKGGAAGNLPEGLPGTKSGWGLAARYEAPYFGIAGGYQADNAVVKHEWKVSAKGVFNPVWLYLNYADAKTFTTSKVRTMGAEIGANLTNNDSVFVNYMDQKEKLAGLNAKQTNYALGYTHKLSKRTSVFADIGRVKVSSNGFQGAIVNNSSGLTIGSAAGSDSFTRYDVGLKHTF